MCIQNFICICIYTCEGHNTRKGVTQEKEEIEMVMNIKREHTMSDREKNGKQPQQGRENGEGQWPT